MFAKTIIDSDAFLDMPLSAQALYFHLSMRADDDGFINNPKKIQRTLGCTDDDLKLLIAKSFIIPFESGIVVIKHWKIHNYLRNDRYKETVYKEERAQLKLKENNAYTLDTDGIPSGIPNGYQMDTQVRLGKVSIGKDRIDEAKEVDASASRSAIDYSAIQQMYNETCPSLRQVRNLSDSRKKAIKARLNSYTLDDMRTVFEKAESSTFLKGGNDRNWSADFDWLIKDSSFVKVLDGKYDDEQPSQPTTLTLGENVTQNASAAAKAALYANLNAQLERMRREDDEKRGIGG